MSLDQKENHKEIKNEIQQERRSFLKKTAYAVPSIVALGHLVHPTTAGAVDSRLDDTNGPGSSVGGNGNGWGTL